MKKLFKKLALMVVALLTFSVGSNYTVKEVKAADTTPVATFDFGANGSASHVDGNDLGKSKSYTSGAYTLALTGMSKVYGPAYDAKGNSCIKLGTSKVVGNFTFTVEDNIEKVVIHAAKYKSSSTKVSINGTATTLTKNSNNGEYDILTVDTSITKTVKFATVSSTYRCMINTIEFYGSNESSSDPKLVLPASADAQIGVPYSFEYISDNLTESIVWASSNEAVATVNDGVVTPLTIGETTITASANGVTDICDIKVYPKENTEISIAEALAVCDLVGGASAPFKYSVTGDIKSIDTAYSSSYGNITVTITDNVNSIKAYRLSGGSDLKVGMNITVTGILKTYNGEKEFDAGATYQVNVLEDDTTDEIVNSLNEINSYMSLSYEYKESKKDVSADETIVDEISYETIGVTDTRYVDWANVYSNSSATFTGQSAGGNEAIQMRTENNNSGIVSVSSGGIAKKITINWNENSNTSRTLDIYGKNEAYTAATDLYDSSKQGTKIGTVAFGTEVELTIDGEYSYIGFKSTSGAIYIDAISIEWNAPEAQTIKRLSNSNFIIRCGADTALSNIENIEAYGVKVSTSQKEVYYANTSSSWGVTSYTDGTTNYCYVVINLGDIINAPEKLTTEFTVCAYAEYQGYRYDSEKTKTYSVVSMIDEYYTNGSEEVKASVEHLYNYFVEKGYIAA